jgi:hypothetical protein
MRRLMLSALLLLFTTLPVYAATYYAGTGGNNSNPCTGAGGKNAQNPSFAKLTLTAGITCLSAGDTLIIRGGTYNEVIGTAGQGLAAAIPSGLSTSQRTTLENFAGETVWLRPAAGVKNDSVDAIISLAGFFIRVSGLHVNGDLRGAVRQPNYGYNVEGTNIVVENVEIKHTGQGFFVSGDAHEMRNFFIHHIAYNPDDSKANCWGGGDFIHDNLCHGFYLSSSEPTNILMENGTITLINGRGIQNYGSPTTFRNVQITNAPVGLGAYRAGGQTYYNNVVVNSSSRAIETFSNNVFVHNTISGPSADHSIHQVGGAVSSIFQNNLILNGIVNSDLGYLYWDGGTHISGNRFADGPVAQVQGNLCDNATMVGCSFISPTPSPVINASGGDFHLPAGSAAIDAGVNTTAVAVAATDKDGVTRPQPPGGARDVGAYERANPGPAVATGRK